MPLILIWGTWVARKKAIFQDKTSILECTSRLILEILSHFPQENNPPNPRTINEEQINKSQPWAYFDRTLKDGLCGGGVILHLSEQHSFHIQLGLGQGINNYVDILTLNILLTSARERNCTHIQIFGDSMLVINWVSKIQNFHNNYSTVLFINCVIAPKFSSFAPREVRCTL